MVWTDLTAMQYIIPFVLGALVTLVGASLIDFASSQDVHCPLCNKKLNDVLALKEHMAEQGEFLR